MPPGVASVGLAHEPHWKASQALAWHPSALSHQLVKSIVESWHVHGLAKRFLGIVPKPDDWTCPGGLVQRITTRVAPQDFASSLRHVSGERLIQSDITLFNEVLDLTCLGSFHFSATVCSERRSDDTYRRRNRSAHQSGTLPFRSLS